MKKIVFILISLMTTSWVSAAGGGGAVGEKAHTNIRSVDSLRNGAKTYMNYCMGCHSMAYQRYNRVAEDLGLTEDEMMNGLVLTDAKFSDKMVIAMTPEQSSAWFNKAVAPDLTVIAKARGVDWLFNFLINFYVDPTRPSGWNNLTFENAGMPHILWELQGIRTANFEMHTDEEGNEHKEFKGFETVQAGLLSEKEYKDLARDLVNFLDYSSEPAQLIRMAYAPWVLLFVSLFTFLAYMLKVNYFRDIH
ncbi:cytochrome c1 [Marinicella litoralis]|uniref:Ubiquinol-cytochrome c reductase cytochrome c1 subunit n=1 Tax=Marinicella litoralis TaxID=644220 RepID=A0A4R6XR21_9GAMM|nr:cytochrome c1 [Marinicella litoralis]TDR20434.1 ubiquinol-cytochrome c reductase cytochrome c1 subunit [Marinicella litoralis]